MVLDARAFDMLYYGMKTTITETSVRRTAHSRSNRRNERGTKAAVLQCVGLLHPMSAALSAAYREMLAHRRTATR